eukprot:COSAG05_NODE_6098_length_1022_cov_1.537378_2_plen_78_part_01
MVRLQPDSPGETIYAGSQRYLFSPRPSLSLTGSRTERNVLCFPQLSSSLTIGTCVRPSQGSYSTALTTELQRLVADTP